MVAMHGCHPPPPARELLVPTPGADGADAGPAALACVPSTSEMGELLIDGRPTGKLVGDGPVKVIGWPDSTKSILVAVVHDYLRPWPAAAGGELLRVGCGAPATVEVFTTREGADFGNARLDGTVGMLYFTDANGVGALNLRSGEVLAVTRAPTVASDCWQYDAGTPIRLRDVVVDLVDGSTLVVHRGGPCGFEGDWVSQELRFTLLGLAAAPEPSQPHPVSTVVASEGGRVWLGDAGRCDEPGVRDLQTEGSVWRSEDDGNTWRRLSVRDDAHRMHTAAAQILVDPNDAGRVLVRSAVCNSAAAQQGGFLFLTRDDGATWQRMELPEAVVEGGQAGHGIRAVSHEGSLDRLTLWTADGRAFRSDDAGATWRELPPSEPPAPANEARSARYSFEATSDGLLRRQLLLPDDASDDLRKPTRVFPQDP